MLVQCYVCGYYYNPKNLPKHFKCHVCGSGSYHYDITLDIETFERARNREIKKHYKKT